VPWKANSWSAPETLLRRRKPDMLATIGATDFCRRAAAGPIAYFTESREP
jgi:hypothetical protein